MPSAARAAVLLAGLLLLAAPCSQAEADLAAQVADLGSEDSNVRIAALNALRAAKDPRAVPLLLEALPAFHLYGRFYGVMVLDSYPPTIARPAFRKVAELGDPYLRLCAGVAYLRMGEEKGGDWIVEGLEAQDVPANERLYMLNRLIGTNHPRVTQAVLDVLRPEEEETFLSSALYVLHFQRDDATMPSVRKLLELDERPSVRAMAAAYLYRFGEVERSAELIEALSESGIGSSPFSRVTYFLEQGGRVAPEILDAVAALLATETNVSVLREAIEFLAEMRYRKSLARIRKLLEHRNDMVAKAAFEALIELGGGMDAETLRPLLDAEEVGARLRAADALRRMGDPSGFPVVLAALKEGNDLQRVEALRALGGFPREEAVGPLLDALLDDNLSVRSAAHTSLGQVWRALFPYRRIDLSTAGSVVTADEGERRAAVGRIRAWWEANRDRDW
jgi:HEAT repeat protein